MAKFNTFYTPSCAYGGHEYFATTDGETVHISERKPASSHFYIVQRLTKAAWDRFADDHDLHDGNRTNPALISGLASATAENDSPYYEYITA